MTGLVVAACLVAAPFAAAESGASAYAEADRLYLYRHIGDNLDKALAALDGKPDDAQALWRRGRCLVRLGERKSAKRARLGAFEEAEKRLRRAVELDPAEPEAHFWLGIALGRIGQTRGILKSLFLVGPIRREMRRTLELDPTHGGAHHVLGEVARQIPGFAGGSKREALAEFEAAVAGSPNYTVNYVALAELYLDLGKKEKARAALEAAMRITAPDDPGEHDENLADVRRLLPRTQ